METETIRAMVKAHAPKPAAIWPNGLAYDWRGWQFMPVSPDTWSARRGGRYGTGPTPDEAREDALSHRPARQQSALAMVR
jgi:hypothetical protein